MIPLPPAIVFFAGALVLALLRKRTDLVLPATGALGVIAALQLGAGDSISLPLSGGLSLLLLRSDPLAGFAGMILSIVGFLALLYASSHMNLWEGVFALLYVGAAMGAVFAGDLLALFIFWELMALAALGIIWTGGTEGAGGAGFRYILMHAAGGSFLLGGIAMQYAITGSLELGPPSAPVPFLFMLAGIGLNAAIVPLHTWVPDAYPSAGTAATVVMSIFTTKVAVYILVRTFAGSGILVLLGAAMAIYGALFALFQSDIRRVLSYSLVSQVGLMVAAIGIGSHASVSAAMAHLASDLVFKTLLFACAGAFVIATGENRLGRMGGIALRMPFVGAMFAVGAGGLMGLPLLSGFVSKGFVLYAVREAGAMAAVAALLLASFVTLLYTFRLLYILFLGRGGELRSKKTPTSGKLAMIGLASICVGIGVIPSLLTGALPFEAYYSPFDAEHLMETCLLIGLAALAFLAGKSRFLEAEADIPDIDVLYRRAGNAFLRLCTGPISLWTARIGELFVSHALKNLAWFAKNPVRAMRIMGYRIVVSAGRFVLPARLVSRYERELTRCRQGYPGDPSVIWGTGYGILLVSLLFLMYLIFLYVQG